MEIDLRADDPRHKPLFDNVHNGLAALLGGRDYPLGQQIKSLRLLRHILLTLQEASVPDKAKNIALDKFAKGLLDQVSKRIDCA